MPGKWSKTYTNDVKHSGGGRFGGRDAIKKGDPRSSRG